MALSVSHVCRHGVQELTLKLHVQQDIVGLDVTVNYLRSQTMNEFDPLREVMGPHAYLHSNHNAQD